MNVLRIHLEGGTAAITVLLQIETYINAVAVLQMGGFIALSKGNTVHRYHAIGEIQMQMTSVTHSAGVTVVDQMPA